MKNPRDQFRFATLSMALLLGAFALDTIIAEALTPKTRHFAEDLTSPDPTSGDRLTEWPAAAVLRGDLVAHIAMARAVLALNRGKIADTPEWAEMRERASSAARQSLSLAPHHSAVWLLVAQLQDQTQSLASDAAVLKMSYLTSAADMDLIPARLNVLSASAALQDVDLQNLARGDIRLILTRRPDLKAAIASAYRGGSPEGKAYIDEVVRLLDPGFAASLP